MELRTGEIAKATGGVRSGPDVTVSGAAIDSRRIGRGELFVPVVAARDGHDFVGNAVRAGAPAYLTSRAPDPAVDATAVEVLDTVDALGALGRHARTRLPDRVIGITGSVGKTSVKDLVAAVLRTRWRAAASPDSFNNELGVPLTLVNAPADADALVVEMGSRGAGHVARLCAIAQPTVGVVTRVAAAHTEAFGGLDAVAAAKGELVEALPPTGTAVLNAGDRRVAAMAGRTSARVLTFGAGGDVRAEAVTLDGELRPSFRLLSPWGPAERVRLAARGEHMVDNALAAAAAALACDVPPAGVAEGLGAATLSRWRMDLARLPSGAVVINDAYNANPASMAAALDALVSLGGDGRRIAVLGLMAELGPSSDAEHRAVGALARKLGVEVVAVGVPGYGGTAVDSIDEVPAALGLLGEGDAVLLKGSRVAGLERLADLLG
ncbi:MAG TPA: UDP-N-acetylmuramoyl-tripeptide--D-alanyl-D-alanine ligase [Acidimicrobiales bacterium]|nr:UDP-N-acetylmuramoyl-tripeptide--D-alanyl-D-alanine ligase [Acidimicrobiales bacterium]